MKSRSPIFHCSISAVEEPELGPAFEIYVRGCNLSCQFCSTRSDWDRMVPEPQAIAQFRAAEQLGVRSLLFAGGEPALHLNTIKRFLARAQAVIPAFLLSNLVIAPARIREMRELNLGLIGTIYFGNDDCAEKISTARQYRARTAQTLELAATLGLKIFLRLLLLPGHWECCALPALEELQKNFPKLRPSVMLNYFPPLLAPERGPLFRYLAAKEKKQAMLFCRSRGLPVLPLRPPAAADAFTDEEAEFIIDGDGRVVAKFATPELVSILCELERKNV